MVFHAVGSSLSVSVLVDLLLVFLIGIGCVDFGGENCISDMEAFQTFLDSNVVAVK